MRNVLLVVATALVLIAAGCGEHGNRLAALQAMAEDTLAYPGSTVLGTTSINQASSIDGPIDADSGHMYGTSAAQPDIVSFYNHALSTTGWTPTSLNSEAATTEVAALAWVKERIVLRLAFLARRDDPRLPSPSIQAAYTTIYRIDLIDHTTDTVPISTR